jgi:hypothetical protein
VANRRSINELATGMTQRLTFDSDYNARRMLPDGKIRFVHATTVSSTRGRIAARSIDGAHVDIARRIAVDCT